MKAVILFGSTSVLACECIGESNGLPPSSFFVDKGFIGDYGSKCFTWDEQDPYCKEDGAFFGESWCTRPWCYVDSECESGIGTLFFDKTEYDWLKWSMDVCD